MMAETEWQSQVATELQIAIQTERCALNFSIYTHR